MVGESDKLHAMRSASSEKTMSFQIGGRILVLTSAPCRYFFPNVHGDVVTAPSPAVLG